MGVHSRTCLCAGGSLDGPHSATRRRARAGGGCSGAVGAMPAATRLSVSSRSAPSRLLFFATFGLHYAQRVLLDFGPSCVKQLLCWTTRTSRLDREGHRHTPAGPGPVAARLLGQGPGIPPRPPSSELDPPRYASSSSRGRSGSALSSWPTPPPCQRQLRRALGRPCLTPARLTTRRQARYPTQLGPPLSPKPFALPLALSKTRRGLLTPSVSPFAPGWRRA